MAKIEAWLSCDLKKPVQVQGLSGNVFSMDNNGSRINVRIYDNGEKTTVSGSVTANCILADGSTINVNGSLTTANGQSVAYVDIPQSCLLVPGPIRIAIKLTASGVITTLAAVVTTVYRTQTDIVITPSAQIINDWNAEISAAIATQNAAIANQDTKINDLKSALTNFDGAFTYGLYWDYSKRTGTTMVRSRSPIVSGAKIKVVIKILAANYTGAVSIGLYGVDSNGSKITDYLIGLNNPVADRTYEYNVIFNQVCDGGFTLEGLNLGSGASVIEFKCLVNIYTDWRIVELEDKTLKLRTDVDNIYSKTENLLIDLPYESGYMYDYNNQGFTKSQAPSNDWKAYDVINIEAGKTYYYVSIRGYFSKIIYNNGNTARLADSDGTYYGSFTAAYNGRIGLTTSSIRYAIFTESEDTYNQFLISATNSLSPDLIIPQLDSVVYNDDYFINRVNMLENCTTVINKGYGRGETWLSDNNALAAITDPIPVKAGVTYYYHNIWAYFCAYRSKEGVITTITDNTEGMASGSFTPSTNGNLYITLNKLSVADYEPTANQDHVNKFLLTTSKEMYEDNVWHTQERNYVFHVGANYEYTNLVAAIQEANKYMDSIVYVHDGEHDFMTEIPAVFGNSYIESVDGSHRGVYLKNRIHLIFASSASIVCNYTGSTQSVKQWLAVFNAGQHGFTIENATIKGSNLRYIIHDERDQDTEQYTNKYINCKMYFDNSANTDWNGNNCIGGGLGRNGHIVVDGCYFESVRRSGQSATGENARGIVTYHNSAGSGKNGIDIHDSYIANVGTVRVTWYGSSPATQKTVAMVSGCSLGSEIITRAEDSSATIENVEMIAWGNEIRTN